MFVFVSLNVTHVPVAVPVQFQETTLTVEEGELENLMVTLTALADHDYDFVVIVTIMNGTAERMHFTQCGFLCSVDYGRISIFLLLYAYFLTVL